MDRRNFVRRGVIGTLAFQVSGSITWLTPRQAHAETVALRHFNVEQQNLLGDFCDHLLPGAREAGVAEFIDQQLGEIPNECMLMCKYFPGINAPYDGFYHAGLIALDEYARRSFEQPFSALSGTQKDKVVQALWEGKAEGWQGPPPPVFYMMLRSDAVDVVYGTEAGFEELGLPYLAHIRPPHDWSKKVSMTAVSEDNDHG